MNNVPPIVAAAIAKREAAGLKLTFLVPSYDGNGGTRPWSCYPSSEKVKAKWIADGKKKGWVLVDNNMSPVVS